MLKKTLFGLLGLIVVLVALGFVLPDKTHVERSAVVNAPQEEVYALVSDLNAVNQWSPWMAYDPEMKMAIAGTGVGQKQTWESKKMGNGSQEIAALDPPNRVDYALDFGEHGVATAAIVLESVAEGTRVTWSFDSNARKNVPSYMQPLATYMGFFMDGMIGKDYEQGLANLKRIAEAS